MENNYNDFGATQRIGTLNNEEIKKGTNKYMNLDITKYLEDF